MKSYRALVKLELAGLLTMYSGAMFFGVAAGIGGVAGLATEHAMNTITGRVAKTEAYQSSIADKKAELGARLDAGEMTFEDYHEAMEKLTDKYAVIEYSKTAGDEELSTTVKNYETSVDCYRTILGKGAGTAGAVTLFGLGAGLVAGKARKKFEEKHGIEVEPEEMAD